MNLKNKKVLVLGLGESGKSTVKFLLNQKAEVYIFDNNELKMFDFLKENLSVKALEYQTEYQISQFSFIVVSPSFRPNHNIISLAKMCEIKCISDIELLYLIKKPFMVGITGSNGKTTTSMLLNEILKEKYKSITCGNIGLPAVETNSQQCDVRVVETSSFQLEYVNKLRFNISVITNIQENHLDWHFNFNDYVKAKANIFKNSKKSDVLILNEDDKNIKKLDLFNFKGKILWFSSKKECKGIFVNNDKIIINIKNKEEVCAVDSVKLLGEHNLQNVLVSVLVAKILNVSNKKITNVLNNFKAPEHRLENFFSFNGVDCFNDSKSTTPTATIAALNALKSYNILLLLGGSSKNLNYENLAKNINKNVKYVFVYGNAKNEISAALNKYNINFIECENINNAIFNSVISSQTLSGVNNTTSHSKNANKNKVAILFSPACASFDNFNSFEERGLYFKEYLKSCVEDVFDITNK